MPSSTALKSLFFLIVAGLFVGGCHVTINDDESIHGSSNLRSEQRTVGTCEGIVIQSEGKVYLTQSDEQSIRIEADDNIIGRVITERRNGLLVVRLKEGHYSDITLHVYASLKNIRNVTIEGAGTIEGVTPIRTTSLDCVINGAGTIDVKGAGDRIECIVNGAGTIDAEGFAASVGNAVVNGAGTCSVSAKDRIDASVNGVGLITYYGDPQSVNTSVSGLGRIRKGN